MPKKTRKSKKITEKKQSVQSVSDLVLGQLQQWAHAGTEEGVKKIEELMARENNKELLQYVSLAYDEALYFYYSPINENEEKDFLLAKLIKDREDRMWRRIGKVEAAKFELSKMNLNREIHRKLLRNVIKKEKEEWKYNFSEDYYLTVRNRKIELEDEIAYEKVWIATAKKMIKNKKYQNVPEDIFDHIHWDGEEETFWEKEEKCECCSCNDEEKLDSATTYLPAPNPSDNYKPILFKEDDIKIEDLPF